MIFSIQYLYWLTGALLLSTAFLIVRDRLHPRRLLAALFWLDLGILFAAGDKMPPASVGVQVIVLSAIAACGGLKRAPVRRLSSVQREESARYLRTKLLIPALAIPICTLGGSLVLSKTKIGASISHGTADFNLISFGIGCIVALGLACWFTRDSPVQAVRQSRELTDAIGWTLVLPQMLAMLGAMFQHTGVGNAIAYLTSYSIPTDVRWIVVATYCGGMTLFSIIMGGAAAAFPLMAGGIAIPILVKNFHGDPATIAALGMFSGYLGVLVTPMAAHFNLIPAALLEIPDRYAVIRAQAPTAILMFFVNAALLYFLM